MAAARVVIVDAANRTITLTPNAAGNFFYAGAVTFPFHAKVTYQGRERIMVGRAVERQLQRLPHAERRERRAGPHHAAVDGRASARGRRTVNVAPCPGSLATSMVPPWSATMRATVASPSPVPPAFVE